MKPITESQFLPVTIIALGAAAVIFGAVLVALREQQRKSLEDDDVWLADTAEVDTSAADITAANEVLGEAAEPREPIDGVSDDQRADPMFDAPEAYVETVMMARSSPEVEASRDRWSSDDMMDGFPARLSGA